VHSSVAFLSVSGDRRDVNEKPRIADDRECVGTSRHYTRTTGKDCDIESFEEFVLSTLINTLLR